MPKATTQIKGARQLMKTLNTLSPAEYRKAISKATRTTAKEVLQDAKALVPHDTGALEKSLTVRAATRLGRGRRGHQVTTRDIFQTEFYGHFVEFGTVNQEPDPFLRPALWGNEQMMRTTFARALRDAIEEIRVKSILAGRKVTVTGGETKAKLRKFEKELMKDQ